VVIVLLAYPLARRLRDGSSATSGVRDANAANELLNRSLQAYQAGKYQDAILDAQSALKARPNFALAYNNLAVSYLQLKQYGDAVRSAEEAIRLQPDLQLAKNNLAWIRQEIAKTNAPAPAPPRAGTADYYLDQSLREYQAGRFEQSVGTAREALKVDPAMAAAYNNIAASYASMKMWDPAIQNAEQALRLKPDLQLARNNLVWALNGKAAAQAGRN
jgi:tetratricopeptide (TPR) repeat protein